MAENGQAKFSKEEREEHKRQSRMNAGLGSILSNIGRGEIKIQKTDTPASNNSADTYVTATPTTTATSSSVSTYESSLRDSVWPKENTSKGGWSAPDDGSVRTEPRKRSRWNSPGRDDKGSSDQQMAELESWEDLKYGDEEIDPVWLAEEHKKLDEKYGEGIMTVKYTDNKTLGYYCTLCLSTMNGITPLEAHCSGMKHLKKKNVFENKKAAGEPTLEGRGSAEPPPLKKKEYKPPRHSRNERDSYSRGERSSSRDDNRHKYEDRERYAREQWAQYSYHGDRLSREGTDAYGRPIVPDPYADRYRDEISRSSSAGIYDYPSSSYSTWLGERSLAYARRPNEPLTSSLLPPVPPSLSLSPPPPKRVALELPLPAPVSFPIAAANNAAVIAAGNNAAATAAAAAAAVAAADNSLAGGPAAALLTKLSQCAIRTESDAELASNVINLLLKSLKGYHHNLGEKNVSDLMEQAEIKLGTAKAIRTIRKAPAVAKTDAFTSAMEVLRRANIQKVLDLAQ